MAPLAPLPFLTGSLLGLLVRAHQAARLRQARLVLAAPSPSSRDILRVSRLDRLLDIVARPEDVPHPADPLPVPSFVLPAPAPAAQSP